MTSAQDQLGVVSPVRPASGEPGPDLEAVQRIARATCAQWYKAHRESGYLVRNKKDPGQYQARQVWPVIFQAFATGLIQEVPDE